MHPENKSGLCKLCQIDRSDRRARKIEQYWNEGLKVKEIAKRLGIEPTHLTSLMRNLRAQGYNLPYRRIEKYPKFPDQLP